jgi:hypothetical protein
LSYHFDKYFLGSVVGDIVLSVMVVVSVETTIFIPEFIGIKLLLWQPLEPEFIMYLHQDFTHRVVEGCMARQPLRTHFPLVMLEPRVDVCSLGSRANCLQSTQFFWSELCCLGWFARRRL